MNLLASRRFAAVVPGLSRRLALGALYLSVPNSWEVHANLTNAQWHLALTLGLLAIAPVSRTRPGRVLDVLLGLLASLSGPFALLVLPLVAHRLVRGRERAFVPFALTVFAGAAVQGAELAVHRTARGAAPLGASIAGLARIVGGKVVLAGLVGQKGLERLLARPHALAALVAASLVAIAVAAAVAAWGAAPLRAFGFYAATVLASGIVFPGGNGEAPAWPFLALPWNNGRYWLIPMLAMLVSLAWLAFSARVPRLARSASALFLALLPVGVVLDWRYAPYAELGWAEKAARVEAAPEGERLVLPIHPPGFSMTLVKKAR